MCHILGVFEVSLLCAEQGGCIYLYVGMCNWLQ